MRQTLPGRASIGNCSRHGARCPQIAVRLRSGHTIDRSGSRGDVRRSGRDEDSPIPCPPSRNVPHQEAPLEAPPSPGKRVSAGHAGFTKKGRHGSGRKGKPSAADGRSMTRPAADSRAARRQLRGTGALKGLRRRIRYLPGVRVDLGSGERSGKTCEAGSSGAAPSFPSTPPLASPH